MNATAPDATALTLPSPGIPGEGSKTNLASTRSRFGNHGGKLPKHLLPTILRTLECLIAKLLGDFKAGMLEEDARSFAIRFETEADLSIGQRTG